MYVGMEVTSKLGKQSFTYICTYICMYIPICWDIENVIIHWEYFSSSARQHKLHHCTNLKCPPFMVTRLGEFSPVGRLYTLGIKKLQK
jgi:hypothetical protein